MIGRWISFKIVLFSGSAGVGIWAPQKAQQELKFLGDISEYKC